MKNFRLNSKHENVVRKSINDFKNDAVKGIAAKLIQDNDELGATGWGRSWGRSWGRIYID